jgi:hypothetical protein
LKNGKIHENFYSESRLKLMSERGEGKSTNSFFLEKNRSVQDPKKHKIKRMITDDFKH